LAATLGLVAAAWVVTVRRMSGMDMGVATRLWTRVRAQLRRLEHRTDAAPGRRKRHERHLDGRDRRRHRRPKLLPANVAVDVPLALAIVGLGVLILIAPSSVPGLTPPM